MFLSLAASIISFILGNYIYYLNRKSMANRVFALGCLSLVLYGFFEFMARQAQNYETAYFWIKLHVFWPFTIVLLFHFILIYTEKNKLLKSKFIYVLLYLPAIIFAYLDRYTNLIQTNIIEKKYWGYNYVLAKDSWVLSVNTFWTFGIVFLGLVLCFHYYLKVTNKKKKSQVKFFLIGTSISALIGLITERLLPPFSIECPPLTSPSLALMAIFIAYAIRKYELFILDPVAAAEQLFSIIPEALFLADIDKLIIKVNSSFIELFDCPENEIIGTPIHFLYKDPKTSSEIIALLFEKGKLISHETVLMTKTGREIPVLFSGSAVSNKKREIIGIIGIFRNISERKGAEENIKQLAFYDQLTHLPNRNLFMDRLTTTLAMTNRHKRICAILFLDIDDFKRINDSLGHSCGDMLIKEVAIRLMKSIRREDAVIRDSQQVVLDTVARIGGDEFIILLSEIDEPSNASIVAERICRILRPPIKIEDKEINITASIGIALYPMDGDNRETLIKNADLAMYKAKSLDKNNYQYYNHTMNINAMNRMIIESELWKALENNEFLLYYQPLCDLKTGTIRGAEALIRWQHPKRGILLPRDFIPVAEDTGLIIDIGNWVFQTVCAHFSNRTMKGQENFDVSINISPKQLSQRNFLETISRIITESGIPPERIILEITENCIINNLENAITIIKEIKSSGIKMALDDFGTGFFSFSIFNRIPFDILKIDRSFIKNIPAVVKDSIITESFISIGHSMILEVIAEGIENEDQLRFLESKGCDTGQGFYFGRPVPEEDLLKMIEDRRK